VSLLIHEDLSIVTERKRTCTQVKLDGYKYDAKQ